MSEKLKKFVDESNQSETLRNRFADDPDQVMAEYGLSDEEKHLLKSENREEVKKRTGTSVADFVWP